MNGLRRYGLWLLSGVVLAACGEGLLRLAEIRGSGFNSGSAQAFGSVVVGGVRYDTSQATIRVDGAPSSEAALMVGDQLLVAGVDNGDGTGSAASVTLESDLVATLDSVDLEAGVLSALGQTVRLDGLTVVADAERAALAAGQGVRISGERDPGGQLRAGSIRVLATPPVTAQVRGAVAAVNAVEQTLQIADLTVDYSATGVAGDVLEPGAIVVARGTETASGLRADALQAAARGAGAAGDAVRVRGLVLARQGDTITVRGQSVRVSPGASVQGGNRAELQTGTDVAVLGLLDADGVVDAATVDVIAPAERELPVRIVAQVQAASAGLINALGLDIRPRSRSLVRDARDGMRPFGVDDLQVGDWVLLRCFGDNGTIVVNRIERIAPADAVEVTAPVIGMDQAADQINVDGVPTDVSAASFEDAQGQAMTRSQFFTRLQDRDFVTVTGDFDGAVLRATRVVLEG